MQEHETQWAQAAAAIREADAMLIGAGAGMGVDSGLPDFRGTQGFWKAYPPFASKQLSLEQVATPELFTTAPDLAWGFYGHRLQLYRETIPHDGFGILRRWASSMPLGAFVYTSNIDGQFQKAGFSEENIVECHGTIHLLQCIGPCQDRLWSAHNVEIAFDEDTFEASSLLPACNKCGKLTRPNILMFDDSTWIRSRVHQQKEGYRKWLSTLDDGGKLVVVECGAGTTVSTIRLVCDVGTRKYDRTLLRINPREAEGEYQTIPLQTGALTALQTIDTLLA